MQSQALKLVLMGGVILGLSLASAPTLHSRTKCANAPAACPEDLKECKKDLEDCFKNCEKEILEFQEATSDVLKQKETLCDYLSIDKKGATLFSRIAYFHEKNNLDKTAYQGLMNVLKEASEKGGCP